MCLIELISWRIGDIWVMGVIGAMGIRWVRAFWELVGAVDWRMLGVWKIGRAHV